MGLHVQTLRALTTARALQASMDHCVRQVRGSRQDNSNSYLGYVELRKEFVGFMLLTETRRLSSAPCLTPLVSFAKLLT